MEILLLFEHNVGESLLIINTVSLLRGIDAHHHLNQIQLIYFDRFRVQPNICTYETFIARIKAHNSITKWKLLINEMWCGLIIRS